MRVSLAERKAQLIQATIEVMRRQGVQRLTLRAVAEEAGAPLATVHYCFESKDELLHSAVEYWLHAMVDLPDLADSKALQIAEVADVIAVSFWSKFEENPQDVLAQIELVTWAVREAPHDLAKGIYERYGSALGEIFERTAVAAAQTLSWDAAELGRAFLVIVDGAALQYLADPDSTRHGQTFRRLLGLLISDAVSGNSSTPAALARHAAS